MPFQCSEAEAKSAPRVEEAVFLVDGSVEKWTGATADVMSPIRGPDGKQINIGKIAMMDDAAAKRALAAARAAWDNGRGEWPQSTVRHRCAVMAQVADAMRARVDEMATLLMWEVCKTKGDSRKEVERTIQYLDQTIQATKDLWNRESTFVEDSGVVAQIRRQPLGVTLCVGPPNYPLNELLTLVLPALIMGCPVVAKLPRPGTLCNTPMLSVFAELLPKGVVNVVTGSGRALFKPLIEDGSIDIMAFIGTSSSADALQKLHPRPHRFRCILGLDAKNVATVLPDADLDNAVEQVVAGSLSFNGQRCTAVKLVWVHSSIADEFNKRLAAAVDKRVTGLPWQSGVANTPIYDGSKPEFLDEMVRDAEKHGAKVINKPSGDVPGDSGYWAPRVVYPVNDKMRVWSEEQFGPLVPVVPFDDPEQVFDFMAKSNYGQQASIFTKSAESAAPLIDEMTMQISRCNLNVAPSRGPDSFPFCGRRDSAMGTLSISDALRSFSIRSLVATKQNPENDALVDDLLSTRKSKFLQVGHLF